MKCNKRGGECFRIGRQIVVGDIPINEIGDDPEPPNLTQNMWDPIQIPGYGWPGESVPSNMTIAGTLDTTKEWRDIAFTHTQLVALRSDGKFTFYNANRSVDRSVLVDPDASAMCFNGAEYLVATSTGTIRKYADDLTMIADVTELGVAVTGLIIDGSYVWAVTADGILKVRMSTGEVEDMFDNPVPGLCTGGLCTLSKMALLDANGVWRLVDMDNDYTIVETSDNIDTPEIVVGCCYHDETHSVWALTDAGSVFNVKL